MASSPSQSEPDITARLRLILHGLRAAMGMWRWDAALTVLFYNRSGQIVAKIERMLLRFRAGRLWRVTRREGGQRRQASIASRGPALPRKFGWAIQAGKHQAVIYGLHLRQLLDEPDMAAMLEAAPQAKRVLRPLLRALSVELPWTVTPPRPPKPRKPRAPRPKPEPYKTPLPRGVITWARREKRLERAREKIKLLLSPA